MARDADRLDDLDDWRALLSVPERHRLGPGVKRYRGSGHRAVRPEVTVARLRPHLGSLGVTRVADVTGLDRIGLPVVAVCRPNARSVTMAMGKGLDLAAAEASGLMEAAEIAHAETIDRPLRLLPMRLLQGATRPIDPLPPLRKGGLPLGEDEPCLWIEGLDLLRQQAVWVPLEAVHASFAPPALPRAGTFRVSSNGLASGNHPLEALAHGLAEVIERDATARWRGLRRSARALRRLDLDSVGDRAARTVLDRIAAAGFTVAVWDTTGPSGIASFYCLLLDNGSDLAHPGEGAGCHPARETALLRALLEAAQVRLAYVTGARDDIFPGEYAPAFVAGRIAAARAWMADPIARAFGEVPTLEAETTAQDVGHMLAGLNGLGTPSAALVDLTRPEPGVPVVRVVAPTLLDEEDEEMP